MSKYSSVRKMYHDSGYVPDSHVCFKNNLNHRSLLRNEIESNGDSFATSISTKNTDLLLNESKCNKVTLSTKIDQIIRDYLDWHADAPDAKMLYVPKLWISKIVNLLTEQQVSTMAREVSKEFKDICLLLRGEFTLPSFLDVIMTWLRINETPNREFQNPDGFRLLIKHDMGYKYSLLIKEIFRCIITDFYHIEMEFIITENTLGIRILMAHDSCQN
jgi:hypothetical protein